MITRSIKLLLAATLLLLPVIGLGTVYLLTGHDSGAGFQPSYITMALIFILAISRALGQIQRPGSMLQSVYRAVPAPYWLIMAGSVAVVLLSALGLRIAPVAENSTLVWGRFLRQFLQLLIMGCFTFFLTVHLSLKRDGHRDRWQSFARFLVFGALVQVVYGLLQEIHFFHPMGFFPGLDRVFTSNPTILSGSETLYLNNTFQDVPRLRGMACEPLYLGNYLLLVWPFVFLTRWSRIWQGLILKPAAAIAATGEFPAEKTMNRWLFSVFKSGL